MRLNKAVSNYWMMHYVTPTGHCQLCANSGMIRLGKRQTAAGIAMYAERVPCICPNGQTLRGSK